MLIVLVYRQVRGEKEPINSPVCVAEYNKSMQGVDRLDQLRNRYSLAKGHSFKKWHKKLALAFIDFARVNAYITRCLALQTSADTDEMVTGKRGAHHRFMCELAKELMFGKWTEAKNESYIHYGQDPESERAVNIQDSPSSQQDSPSTQRRTPFQSPVQCVVQDSKQYFSKVVQGSRTRRGCVVCRFENRHPCEVSDYCITHSVALCTKQYSPPNTTLSFVCSSVMWTCWKKFHDYYLPQGLFNSNGHICKMNPMNLARSEYLKKKTVKSSGTNDGDKENYRPNKRRKTLTFEDDFSLLDISIISNASTEY
jgi:hypothetical protein